MKKIGLMIGGLAALAVAFASAPAVNAAGVTVCASGCDYTTLKAAFDGVADGDTITLMEDQLDMAARALMPVGDTRAITLDLNGYDISMSKAPIVVYQGHLTITGTGTIEETATIFGSSQASIVVGGSSDPTATNYTTLTVGPNVILKATFTGIFVSYHPTSVGPHAYGLTVNFNGKAVIPGDPVNGISGQGINITGNIKDTTGNVPVINVNNGSSITVDYGPGIYAPGYANWNFNGGNITGYSSALAIKSGKVVINDGTFTATGPDETPTIGWLSGINASGAAIQIEANSSYAGNVDLTINDGTFVSMNGRVFYEYLASNATDTAVSSVEINDGSFTSGTGKDVFTVSEEFANSISGFVYGGTFSSDPSAFAADGVEFVMDANGTFTTGTTEEPGPDGVGSNGETNPDTSDALVIFAIAGLVGLIGLGVGARLIRARR